MLPKFPNFKSIELDDRKLIEFYTHSISSYSDFNFTSLWLWDKGNKRQFSELNNNLVILFTDYQTGEKVLSFLGMNQVNETTTKLLEYAKDNGLLPILKYVPAETAELISDTNLEITEDHDNHDYILSTEKISQLTGNEMKPKRRLAQKFAAAYPDATFKTGNMLDPEINTGITSLFEQWKNNKNNLASDEKEELTLVLNRLIEHPINEKFIFSFLFVGNKIIAFAADEILPDQTAISHFVTADTNYIGVYEYFNKRTAQELLNHGCISWNWEQDLGLPTLKSVKNSYRPQSKLKKYQIKFAKRSIWNLFRIFKNVTTQTI